MGNQFNYTWGFTHTVIEAGLTHSFVAGIAAGRSPSILSSFIVDDLAAPYISKVTGAVTGRLAQGRNCSPADRVSLLEASTSINYGQSIGLNRGGSKVDLIDKPNLFQKSLAYLSVITNSVAMIVSGFEDQWGSNIGAAPTSTGAISSAIAATLHFSLLTCRACERRCPAAEGTDKISRSERKWLKRNSESQGPSIASRTMIGRRTNQDTRSRSRTKMWSSSGRSPTFRWP